MPEAVPLIAGGGGMNIAQLIQAITPLLGGTGTTTTGQTGTTSQTQGQTGSLAIDPAINQLLTSLFGQVTGGTSGFTKEQAIADSQNALQNLARMAVEQNMPSVLGGGQAAGLYNDTTRTLLNNDLQSRIAAQGAQLIQDNIAKYAAITQQGQQTAASIGNTLAQGNRAQTQQTTNQQATTEQRQQTTSPVIGGSAKNNALLGAGITAGGTLLKNWDDLAKMFGNVGSPAFDVGSIVNPGNMLNAGYGIESGIGGAAPSLGAALDFGSSLPSNLGSLSDGLSGIFTDAPAADTLSGIFTEAPAQAGSGLAGALSGIGGSFDWLTDAFSGLGDFFGGFFANGGQIPTKKQIASNNAKAKGNYANGGQVTQKGVGEAPGRKGRAAYTSEAAGSRIFDISRALWEELQRGGGPPQERPTLGNDTQVVAPGVNEGAGGGIMPRFRGPDAQLAAVVDNIRNQMQARAEAAEPTRGEQLQKGALQARSANQTGSRIIDAATGVDAATTLAAAEGLGGASSALAGSPIQQALQASMAADAGTAAGAGAGVAGDVAAGAAGAGAGAAATGATLGTVDVLGSLAGTGAFLPTYGSAATGAGLSGASGAFGGAAGTGGGATAGGGAAAASSALSATGVGAVVALLVNSFLPIIFGGFEGTKKSDEWIRAALDPASTFNNDLVVGDLTSNFFRDFYKGQGTGASTADLQSQYEAARNVINSDAFTTYIPGVFSNTGQAAQGDYEGYFGAEDEAKARAAANYLNDQLFTNPEYVSQLTQNPAIAPGALAAETSPGLALGLALGGYTYPMLAAEEAGLPYPGYTPSTGPDGAANGGMIGRDKTDPQGKADDILIHVSGGEYVIPKSVVDAVGSQFFDNLVDKFHTPFPDRPPTR